MTTRTSMLFLVLVGVAGPAAPGFAQSQPVDLASLSIEELMTIKVISASHKEQKTRDVAAAVSVITQEDILRSGMTTVPELLRLVPGVQVARINSNKWAISVRGFNNLFSEKLLVLVDGRTVYDRLNSGLFWESLDIPVDQIARIEVVRGPGGATWGANAVNGVINIVMKSARDLPGGNVSVSAGTLDGALAGVRYGGAIGRVAYRVYSQWSNRGQSLIDTTRSANDSWQSQVYGVRLDWTRGRDTVVGEGGARLQTLRALPNQLTGPVPAVAQVESDRLHTHGYDATSRWTHRRDNGALLQVQSSLAYFNIDNLVAPVQTQADLDAQYQLALGSRHDVVIGAGYRWVDERVRGAFRFSIAPDHVVESVVNLFAQDEIAVARRVTLTVGAKVERDSYVGWGVQPTVRVMWVPAPQQRVWAAASRALRTPSLGDVSGRFNFTSFVGEGGVPVVVGALGNPALQSERVVDTEVGYRREIGSVASVDVTAFAARYDKLKTSEPLPPHTELTPAPAHLFIPFQFANLLEASSSGVEVELHWTPTRWWRVDGSYSTFHLTPHLSAMSGDLTAASFDGNAPRAQWQARSALTFPRGVESTILLFRVGAVSSMPVGAYTRADVRVGVPLSRHLSLSVVGQNLSSRAHAELAGPGAILTTPTLIPRSASIGLVWAQR